MEYILLKSKIHKANITHCDLHYEGSLEIDIEFMNEIGMLPYEKIQVVNITNGQRIETYAIPGTSGSKVFRINGAAARRAEAGDVITIMSYGNYDEKEVVDYKPKVIVLDEENNIIMRKGLIS